MKRFVRNTIVIGAALMSFGSIALADDNPPVYAPPPIVYDPSPMPSTMPPPAPPSTLTTGIPVGPAIIRPTFPPPGIQVQIPFD
jgi:hypothetical protein